MQRCKTSIGFSDRRTIPGELLWPERFGPTEIAKLKRDLGPYGYSGQFQQSPSPSEGGIVKRAWLRPWRRLEDGRIWVQDGLYQYDPWKHPRFCTVDLATTEKEIGGPKSGTKSDPDFTVMAAWSVFPAHTGPILVLLDLVRERMEGPDILPRLEAFHRVHKFYFVAVENVAERTIYQTAKRTCSFSLRDMNTREDAFVRIETNKTGRLMAAVPLMADGRFYVPEYEPWLAEFVRELCVFPNAAHDDQVDVAVYGCMIAEKFRTTRRFDSGPEKQEAHVFSDHRRPDDASVSPTDGYFVANPF